MKNLERMVGTDYYSAYLRGPWDVSAERRVRRELARSMNLPLSRCLLIHRFPNFNNETSTITYRAFIGQKRGDGLYGFQRLHEPAVHYLKELAKLRRPQMVFEKSKNEEVARIGPVAWAEYGALSPAELIARNYAMNKPLKDGDEVQYTYTLTIANPDGSDPQDIPHIADLTNTHLEWFDFDPEDLPAANQKDDELRAVMRARGSDFVNRTVEIDPLSLTARAFYTSVCPGGCDHD